MHPAAGRANRPKLALNGRRGEGRPTLAAKTGPHRASNEKRRTAVAARPWGRRRNLGNYRQRPEWTLPCSVEKEWPQAQVETAFGLLMVKPEPISPSM